MSVTSVNTQTYSGITRDNHDFTSSLERQNMPKRVATSVAVSDRTSEIQNRNNLERFIQRNDIMNARALLHNGFPQGLQDYSWGGETLSQVARSPHMDHSAMAQLLLRNGAPLDSVGGIQFYTHVRKTNNISMERFLGSIPPVALSGENILKAAYRIVDSHSPQDMAAFLLRFGSMNLRNNLGKDLVDYAQGLVPHALNHDDAMQRQQVADMLRGRFELDNDVESD